MILKAINDIEVFCNNAEKHIGVFGSKDWLSIYGNELKMVGIYKDEHQLVGGFYYLETKKYGLKFIKLPPYTPHCGLFFTTESKNKASANSFAKEVVTEVCTYFSTLNAALTVLAFPSQIIDLQPFIWSKFKVVPNYTYRISLDKSIEDIRANFDPKNRNAINKAVKDGVEVTTNTLPGEKLFAFFTNSLIAAGANVYTANLSDVFNKFSKHTNSFSQEAWKDGKLIGVVFCVYDKQSCYYLLGGVDKESGIQGVNNLLVQKSIERAKNLGCSIFDFEGSMLKGVEKFFRSFGPELFPYYTVNKANVLIEVVLKFYKRHIF